MTLGISHRHSSSSNNMEDDSKDNEDKSISHSSSDDSPNEGDKQFHLLLTEFLQDNTTIFNFISASYTTTNIKLYLRMVAEATQQAE
eukprot:6513127-Ditylum_brightwellii.AAC.1